MAFVSIDVCGGTEDVLGQSIPELVALSQAEDPGVRNRAIVALGKAGGPEAEAALVVALSDVEWGNRWRAAEGLGKIGGVSSVASLVGQISAEVATEDMLSECDQYHSIPLHGYVPWPEFVQRQMAIAAREILERDGSPEGRACKDALIGMTRDAEESPRVRAHIGLLLAEHGEREMIPLMIDVLESEPSGALRAFAAEALGDLRAEAAVPALRRALDDPYATPKKGLPLVRDAAARALQKIEEAG